MNLRIRQGTREDSSRIAELDYIASDGAVEYLFHDVVPDMSALDLLTQGLRQGVYPHSFESCLVAEFDNNIVGMTLSYPATFHRITDELSRFLPPERLAHFHDFYSSRVEGSYFLDAMCVDKTFRHRGIGKTLLQKTKQKARDEGFTQLSLIVFADNTGAITLYRSQGFKQVKQIHLEAHALIPHRGGCLLMNCAL